MARVLIDLTRPVSLDYRDVRDLLQKFESLKDVKREDELTVLLPKEDTVSDLALAIIWTKLKEFQESPCKQKNLIYSASSAKYFNERHFFDQLLGKKSSGFFSKRIPFHFDTFNLHENENDTANKIADAAHSSIESTPLGQEAKIHILELVSNAFHHSKATRAVGCISQFKTSPGVFEFSMADQGNGIRKSFLRNPAIRSKFDYLTEPDLLEKATDQYVTCNPYNAPQYEHKNAGIGLHFLREFCKYHNGFLVIVSGRGYCYIDGRRVKKSLLKTPWEGTVVSFRANLHKTMSPIYTASKEKFLSDFDDKIFEFRK